MATGGGSFQESKIWTNQEKRVWKIPTDILYGDHDELVYIENVADFLAAHPSAKLTIKQGAEHYMHTKIEKEFIKKWILNVIKLFRKFT